VTDTDATLPAPLIERVRGIEVEASLLVCCDFDGTLAPIVTRPEDARPLTGIPPLLEQLAAADHTTVAVISGRSLADLHTLSGLSAPIVLVGSHGAEFEAGFVEELTTGQQQLFARLDTTLTELAATAPGVQLEHKPASIAVHVRQASRPDANRVMAELWEGPVSWPGIHATAGKEVLELAVLKVDKGGAVSHLRDSAAADVAIFVGDDVTDENAFRVLRREDVGVKVGDGETAAEYRIPSVSAVRSLLALLAAVR